MSPRLRAVIGRYLVAPVSPSRIGCTSPSQTPATTSPGRISPLRVTEPSQPSSTDARPATVSPPETVAHSSRSENELLDRFNDEGNDPYQEGEEWL